MLTCCFLEVLLCFLGQFLNGRQVSLESRLKDKHQSAGKMWELQKKTTKKWFSNGLSFHLKWQKQRYSDHTTSSHPPALLSPALSLFPRRQLKRSDCNFSRVYSLALWSSRPTGMVTWTADGSRGSASSARTDRQDQQPPSYSGPPGSAEELITVLVGTPCG